MAIEVLIVDDRPVLREILQAVTRKALKEASVAAVNDLASALERAGRQRFHELHGYGRDEKRTERKDELGPSTARFQ